MKTFWLILSLLLVADSARAQSLGCYVNNAVLTQYNALFLCGLTNTHPSCGSSFIDNYNAFGGSLAETCEEFNDTVNSLVQCNAAYTDLRAHWSACGDSYKQVNGVLLYYKGLSDYYEQSLAPRLRAACGKKCRNIQ